MKHLSLLVAIGISFLSCAPTAAPLQQSNSIAVGNSPFTIATDPVTGRVFVSNGGTDRARTGNSVAVVSPDGQVTQVATPSPPTMIAVGATQRKAVVGQYNCACVAIVDADTLAVSTVSTGSNPIRAIVVERTGFAYVANTGFVSGVAGTSSLTAIDLRSGQSTTYPVSGFGIVDIAASADGKRIYLIGTDRAGFAEYLYGYVQAFDVASGAMVGMRTPLGRLSRQIMASPDGDALYVLGHVEFARDLPMPDPRAKGVRPALFVLDPATLATRRTIELPDTKDLNLYAVMEGNIDLDPAAGVVYALDKWNQRFSVVDAATGSVRVVDLESIGFALAFNAVTKSVVVQLAFPGAAAVYSLAGERLDTVPFGRSASAGQFLGTYQMAVDARGNVYGTDSYHGALAILHPPADMEASLVNVTDLWSNPAEPGWGVYVQQQGLTALAALFTHDASGFPEWLIMPNGARQADGSFSGALYRTRGPVADAIKNALQVGTMRFTPDTQGGAALAYQADGVAVAKSVQRLSFGSTQRKCGWAVAATDTTLAASGNFTALWWNPAQAGWGLAVSQQGDTTFGVLFDYDASNRPSWTVMSNGVRKSAGAFSGSLYRAPSGAVQTVGDMSIDFTSADAGTLKYRLDAMDYAKPIVRQEFSTPSSRCSS